MESNNAANNSDLLVKLNRLEDQVSTLSSQLEFNKIMITQLKQSVVDRDLQISELEMKLTAAQYSLQKKAFDKIEQCREQIKNGVDIKLVNPVLTQIQKYLERVECLVAEAKDFISNKKAKLQDNLNYTSNLIHQAPGYAINYFEKNVVEPANALVKKTMQAVDSSYKGGMDWFEQELLDPGKIILDRIVFVAQEWPLDAKLVLQTRVIDPVLTYADNLPGYLNEFWVKLLALIKHLIILIRKMIQQSLDFIAEQVKKSSFWDGKQRMQAA